jgi:hypothetical protein
LEKNAPCGNYSISSITGLLFLSKSISNKLPDAFRTLFTLIQSDMNSRFLHKALYRCTKRGLQTSALLLLGSMASQAQSLDWANHLVSATGNVSIGGKTIARSLTGKVFVAGAFRGATDFDPGSATVSVSPLGANSYNSFLAQYNDNGNYAWVRRIMGSNSNSVAYSVAVDNNENIYVAGQNQGTSYFETAGGTDSIVGVAAYLQKFDNSGGLLWSKGYTGTGVGINTCITSTDAVYVTGIYSGTKDFNPGGTGGTLSAQGTNSNTFIVKYSLDGSFIWAKSIGGKGVAFAEAITLDTTGTDDRLLLTGHFNDTIDFDPGPGTAAIIGDAAAARWSTFIASYDTAGTYNWAKAIHPGNAGATNRSNGDVIAVDTQGNILITGYLMGAADFDPGPATNTLTGIGLQDMYLAKYTPTGDLIWAQNIGGSGGVAAGYALALDALGNAYVTGIFGYSTIDFDPGAGTSAITPGGSSDVFIAKYGTCGSLIKATSLPGSGTSATYSYGIVLDEEDALYITGSFKGTVDFDPGPGSNTLTAAQDNIYISKLRFPADDMPRNDIEILACGESSYVFNGVTYSQSGTYNQLFPAANYCDSLVVLHLTLSPMSTPQITENNLELSVPGTYATYQWLQDGVSIPGAVNNSYTATQNGDYVVAVSNADGCSDTSEVYTVTGLAISSSDLLSKAISIYPNPTSNHLRIHAPASVVATLYSLEGKKILEAGPSQSLSLEPYADGIYILQFRNNEGKIIKHEKVIKHSTRQ